MKRIWMSLLAILIACPAMAAGGGDDGLHKTDWMRDTFKDLRAGSTSGRMGRRIEAARRLNKFKKQNLTLLKPETVF